MSIWDQIFKFLSDQWPALLILVFQFMQSAAIRSRFKEQNQTMTQNMKEAHEKIDARFAGMSPDAVIKSFAGPGDLKPESDTDIKSS